MTNLARIKGTMPQLFPVDDERSSWMWALSLLRQDLSYEFAHLGWDQTREFDKRSDNFGIIYRLRKLSITFSELRQVLGHFASKSAKKSPALYPAGLKARLTEANLALVEFDDFYSIIRQSGGAHVAMAHAEQELKGQLADGDNLLKVMGRNLTKFEVAVEIDRDPSTFGRLTNLEEPGAAFLHIVWPDVTSDEDYDRKHSELQAKMSAASRKVMPVVDELLLAFWKEHGLLCE